MKRLIAALIFVPSVAFAAPLDFTKELIGKDRQPFRECVEVDKVEKTKCVNEINVTLGWLTATALDIPKQGMSGAERTKRGRLAYKVMDASEVELDAAEIKLILDALDDLQYKNTAIYAAKRLLDPVGADK